MPDFKSVHVRIHPEIHKKVVAYAEKTGFSIADIAKEALMIRFEQLEEKAALKKAERKLVPTVERYKAPGLGVNREATPIKTWKNTLDERRAKNNIVDAVQKCSEKYFVRWAEFLEAAKSKVESAERVSAILEDIRDMSKSPQEGSAIYEKFLEFLKTRKDMREELLAKPTNQEVAPAEGALKELAQNSSQTNS